MRADFPDIRSLLILVLVLTTLAILLNSPLFLAALLLATIVALLAAGLPLAQLGKILWRYRWLFFILALVQSLTEGSGQILWQGWGYVLLSTGGLTAALAALLRIAVILAAVQLLSLRDYQQLVRGLAQLGAPYELAFMVLLAVRFIPVLAEEFRNSLVAIQLRGVDLRAIPLREKVRVYSSILMPTTAGALIRSQRIAVAMEARAFRAYPKRTWLEWPRLGAGDWALIALALGIGTGVTWLKIRGFIS